MTQRAYSPTKGIVQHVDQHRAGFAVIDASELYKRAVEAASQGYLTEHDGCRFSTTRAGRELLMAHCPGCGDLARGDQNGFCEACAMAEAYEERYGVTP